MKNLVGHSTIVSFCDKRQRDVFWLLWQRTWQDVGPEIRDFVFAIIMTTARDNATTRQRGTFTIIGGGGRVKMYSSPCRSSPHHAWNFYSKIENSSRKAAPISDVLPFATRPGECLVKTMPLLFLSNKRVLLLWNERRDAHHWLAIASQSMYESMLLISDTFSSRHRQATTFRVFNVVLLLRYIAKVIASAQLRWVLLLWAMVQQLQWAFMGRKNVDTFVTLSIYKCM